MPEQPELIASIRYSLDTAAKELRLALDSIAQAQAALGQLPEHDESQHVSELEALWQHLNDLGRPVVNAGAYVISAMREIGEQIGASPTAPNQLDWLLGIDARARQAGQTNQQRASALLEWLEPYLDRVSPRTRTAVTQAIKRAASAEAPQALIERLTPETFMQDLQRGHTGFVANIRGLGPRGLQELRKAMEQDSVAGSSSGSEETTY